MPGLLHADTTGAEHEEGMKPRLVVGWLLNIRVYPGGHLMKAKLDTGARSNAMHAEDIAFFDADDGTRMVRFTLLDDHDDPDSERWVFERPVEDQVNIKRRLTSRTEERPVVELEFCMAGVRHTGVFSLTDRSNFNYPVLLGRDFLKDDYLVDPGESFTHRTDCRRK